MFRALVGVPDHRYLLLGLTEGNLQVMRGGNPILVEGRQLGTKEFDLLVIADKDRVYLPTSVESKIARGDKVVILPIHSWDLERYPQKTKYMHINVIAFRINCDAQTYRDRLQKAGVLKGEVFVLKKDFDAVELIRIGRTPS